MVNSKQKTKVSCHKRDRETILQINLNFIMAHWMMADLHFV